MADDSFGEKRFLNKFVFQATSIDSYENDYDLTNIKGMLYALDREHDIHPFELIGFLECVARQLRDLSNTRTLWHLLVYFCTGQ